MKNSKKVTLSNLPKEKALSLDEMLQKYCIWIQDIDFEYMWKITCNDNRWYFDIGPIKEGYKFCPFCGKEIKEFNDN